MHGQGSKSWNPVNNDTARGLKGGIDRSPQMCKNLGQRFDKESEGYLLIPSLHVANPVWEEITDTINT